MTYKMLLLEQCSTVASRKYTHPPFSLKVIAKGGQGQGKLTNYIALSETYKCRICQIFISESHIFDYHEDGMFSMACTVAVNKKVYIPYSYNDRSTNQKSPFCSTQFFRTMIADSAIITVPSKRLNSPTFISMYMYK